MKFHVGDKVTSKVDNGYSHTGINCICEVVKAGPFLLEVKVIKPGKEGHRGSIGRVYPVEPDKFVLCRPHMEENE